MPVRYLMQSFFAARLVTAAMLRFPAKTLPFPVAMLPFMAKTLLFLAKTLTYKWAAGRVHAGAGWRSDPDLPMGRIRRLVLAPTRICYARPLYAATTAQY